MSHDRLPNANTDGALTLDQVLATAVDDVTLVSDLAELQSSRGPAPTAGRVARTTSDGTYYLGDGSAWVDAGSVSWGSPNNPITATPEEFVGVAVFPDSISEIREKCSAGGQTVIPRQGTYLVGDSDPISLADDTTLILNRGVTLKQEAAVSNGSAILDNSDTTNGNSNIRVIGYGGSLDGNSQNQTITAGNDFLFGVLFENVDDVVIDGLDMPNIAGVGIDVTNAKNVDIQNCETVVWEDGYAFTDVQDSSIERNRAELVSGLSYAQPNGVEIQEGSQNILVSRNRLFEFDGGVQTAGVMIKTHDVDSIDTVKVEGNYTEVEGDSNAQHYRVIGTSANKVRNVEFVNNDGIVRTFEEFKVDGVRLEFVDNVSVRGGLLEKAGGGGVQADEDVTNLSVIDVTFDECRYSIFWNNTGDNSTPFTIMGNTFVNEQQEPLTPEILDNGMADHISGNDGYVSDNSGSTSASDTDTIAHGLDDTPPVALSRVETESSNRAYVTGTDGTNLTIALEDPSGTAVTADETVYWSASLTP